MIITYIFIITTRMYIIYYCYYIYVYIHTPLWNIAVTYIYILQYYIICIHTIPTYIYIYIYSKEYTHIPCSKVVWPKVSRLCLQLSQHCQHLRRLSLSVPWRNGSVGFHGDFMGISPGKMVVSLGKMVVLLGKFHVTTGDFMGKGFMN